MTSSTLWPCNNNKYYNNWLWYSHPLQLQALVWRWIVNHRMMHRRVEGAPQSFYRDLSRLLLQRIHQCVLGRRTDNFTFRRVQHARSAFAARSLSCALFRHLNVDRGLNSCPRPGTTLRWGWRRSADALDRLGQVKGLHVGEFVAELGEGANLLARARVHLAGADHFQHLAQILNDFLEGLRSAQVEQDATLREQT